MRLKNLAAFRPAHTCRHKSSQLLSFSPDHLSRKNTGKKRSKPKFRFINYPIMSTVFPQSSIISFEPTDATHAELVNAFKDDSIQLSSSNLEVLNNCGELADWEPLTLQIFAPRLLFVLLDEYYFSIGVAGVLLLLF